MKISNLALTIISLSFLTWNLIAQSGTYSDLLLQGDGAEIRLEAQNTNVNPSGVIIFEEGPNYKNFQIIYDGTEGTDSSDGRLIFDGSGAGNIMTLSRSGNVGIGTTVPKSTLHLFTANGNEIARFQTDAGSGSVQGHGYLGLTAFSSTTYPHVAIGYEEAAGGSYKGRLIFSTRTEDTDVKPVEHLRIDENGFVGIGTPSPSYPLSVNGTIQAKEVIVETGWSDFVFEDSYKLLSLAEVETHIEEHGHLPGVPSASAVQSEGLSVGEAQTIMMQKIEELTLYVIAQQKEIDDLKSELSQQNARYNSE